MVVENLSELMSEVGAILRWKVRKTVPEPADSEEELERVLNKFKAIVALIEKLVEERKKQFIVNDEVSQTVQSGSSVITVANGNPAL